MSALLRELLARLRTRRTAPAPADGLEALVRGAPYARSERFAVLARDTCGAVHGPTRPVTSHPR